MTTWEPMSVGGRGQWTGNIWSLHAYAHPKVSRGAWATPARWTLYRHTLKVAEGTAPTIALARRAAEAAMDAASHAVSTAP